MANPKVVEILNDECSKKHQSDLIVLSQKQKVENFHQEYLKNVAAGLHTNRFRESLSDKIAAVEVIINGQITNQQKTIMKKLEERKKKLNRPKSQPPSRRIIEEEEKTPVFSKSLS